MPLGTLGQPFKPLGRPSRPTDEPAQWNPPLRSEDFAIWEKIALIAPFLWSQFATHGTRAQAMRTAARMDGGHAPPSSHTLTVSEGLHTGSGLRATPSPTKSHPPPPPQALLPRN